MYQPLLLSLLLSYPVISYTVTTLEYTMQYPMESIVNRYCNDYKVSKEDAKLHERELKRYLYLCAQNPDISLGMFSSTIDNLWHTFIIYTTNYKDFCKNAAGHFMHHVPNEQEKQDPEGYQTFVSLYEQTFGEQLPAVWGKTMFGTCDKGGNCSKSCNPHKKDCDHVDKCSILTKTNLKKECIADCGACHDSRNKISKGCAHCLVSCHTEEKKLAINKPS